MDDVYEVDNRYPEVAEPYERIRGGRHHDRLNGARACRTARVNSLKRSFWTSAAAVVAAVTLLLASPGEKPNAVEPEAFLEPELSIVAAARPEADRLEYQYRIELNDAEQAEVTVAARTAEGELLASAGPFLHTRTENAEPLAFLIPGGEDCSKIVLELTCTYTREGETREKRAARELELANAPPETVTEQTEPEETKVGSMYFLKLKPVRVLLPRLVE